MAAESKDHKAEAARLVAAVGDPASPSQTPQPEDDDILASAQVHASLAIAEQLERLNEKLNGVDLEGHISGLLDNLHSSINEIVWRNTGGGR